MMESSWELFNSLLLIEWLLILRYLVQRQTIELIIGIVVLVVCFNVGKRDRLIAIMNFLIAIYPISTI